jgi:hypothetical protein
MGGVDGHGLVPVSPDRDFGHPLERVPGANAVIVHSCVYPADVSGWDAPPQRDPNRGPPGPSPLAVKPAGAAHPRGPSPSTQPSRSAMMSLS